MDDKKGLPWLLLLMMFSGLGVAVGLPGSSAPAPVAVAQPVAKEVEVAGAKPVPSPSECLVRAEALAASGYEVEVVLTTVPDPHDSLYPRLFDLFSAAIRRATEEMGYSEDSSCLPWTTADTKTAGGKETPTYRTEPGWLLFRRNDTGATTTEPFKKPGALVVLMVGESPPRGVHAKALEAALDDAVRLQGGWGRAQTVRLLGPTFSSSAVSLALTLKAWAAELPTPRADLAFKILSGSATAGGLETVISRVIGSPAQLTVSFESLATPDSMLRDALFDTFLPQQFHHSLGSEASTQPRVALLVESSLYGRGFLETPGASALIVPFPMHISALRSEYEKEAGGKAKAADGGQEATGLSLAAGADAQARDALRVFDVTGTSRTQDLELAHQLAYISRERIPYVGIVATNIRDTLFLAGLLRKHAPDVRLFTFEGDLLLSHPSFAAATRGMLVVSSHPLEEPPPFSLGVAATPPTQPGVTTLLRFGSDATHGVYRGLRAMLENRRPGREVWISAVGRHGLYPIRHFPLDASTKTPPSLKEQWRRLWALSPIPPPPRGWTLLLLTFTAIAFLAGALLLWELKTGKKRSTRAGGRRRTLLYLLIALAVLLPCSVAGGPALASSEGWGWVTFVTFLDLILLLFLAGRFLVQLVAQTREAAKAVNPPGFWSLYREQFFGLLAVAVYLGMMAYNVSLLVEDPASVPLFLERMIRFGSGLSPFLPTLLWIGVILAWLLLALRRLDGLEALPETVTVEPGWRETLSPRFWTALAEVQWAVGPGGHYRLTAEDSGALRNRRIALRLAVWGLGLVVPVLYLCCYYNQGNSTLQPALRTLETWGFSWEASLLFTLALACALEAGLALWRGWRSLQRLVNELQDLELGPPAGAAKEGAPKLPGWVEEIEAVAKPGIDAEERMIEQRDLALARWRQKLADTALHGPYPAAEILELRRATPASEVEPTAHDHGRLWVTLACWAGLRRQAGGPLDPAPDSLARHAASFFAWQTALAIGETSKRLVALMRFLTLGLLGVLVAVSVYPFEPERVITFYVGSLIAAAVLLSLAFVFQAEKNPMLSHLAGTEAGRITWHRSLLQKLGLYAVVPLLTLLTRQIPQLQQLFGALLEPLSKVFQ